MNAAQRRAQLLSSAGHSCYYTYDASSNVTRRVMGNGVVSYATFDRTDRMLSLRYATSGGAGLAYFDYGRDVAGRILRIQREATAGYAIYYAYDNIDRLEAEVWRKTSDNSQVYGFWYSYDAANNRLQQRRETTAGVTWDSTYYQYAVDNSLVRRQVATPPSTVVDTYYGYDANGALTQVLEGANATYFGYGANQLVTRILPPAEAATYFSYDGRLNRYYIDKAGTQTYYLWDGLNQLEERDGSGTLLARYTQGNYRQYGIGSVVEIERHVGAATYYQYGLGDHRGTFYKITDQNQNVQLDYTLDAFGRQLAAPGGSNPAVPNDLIYQTNWLTMRIGGRLYGISRYRLYDFETGCFFSKDPLSGQSIRSQNLYVAFNSDSVNKVDVAGLEVELVNENGENKSVTVKENDKYFNGIVGEKEKSILKAMIANMYRFKYSCFDDLKMALARRAKFIELFRGFVNSKKESWGKRDIPDDIIKNAKDANDLIDKVYETKDKSFKTDCQFAVEVARWKFMKESNPEGTNEALKRDKGESDQDYEIRLRRTIFGVGDVGGKDSREGSRYRDPAPGDQVNFENHPNYKKQVELAVKRGAKPGEVITDYQSINAVMSDIDKYIYFPAGEDSTANVIMALVDGYNGIACIKPNEKIKPSDLNQKPLIFWEPDLDLRLDRKK